MSAKRKTGRPAYPIEKARIHTVAFRVQPGAFAALQRIAEKQSVSVHVAARRLVIEHLARQGR